MGEQTAKPMITSITAPKNAKPLPSWMQAVPRLEDIKKGEGENFLIYGGAGTGKTFFAGSAGERSLIINNGGGMNTLMSPLFQSKYGKINPIVVTVSEGMNERGVFDTAQVFDEICDVLDYYLKEHGDKFDNVIIDDVTQLRRGALNKGLELNQAQNKSQTLNNVVRKYDVVAAAVQDYQAEMNLIEQFLASYTTIFKEAGKNFIMNAHQRLTFEKADKIGEPKKLMMCAPGFTGETFPDTAVAYFDNVWYFQAVSGGSNRVYRATTQGHEKLMAKTRWGGVFETVETNPSFPDVMKRIRESTPENMRKKK